MRTIALLLSILAVSQTSAIWAQDAKKDHAQMKKEHEQAHQEHDAWLKQIGRWRVEHRRALSALREIEAHILAHEASLEELAEHAREHEDHMIHHDDEIADHEKGGSGRSHEELEKLHKKLLERHTAFKKQLATFDDEHDDLMVGLNKLKALLKKEK